MIVIIYIICALMSIIYLYFDWNHNYWLKKNVPHDKPSLFFGNMKNAINGSRHFGVHYMELYNKFQDVPYFGFYKMREPGIVIRDPDLVKNIIIRDFSYFTDNDFQVDPDVDPIWAHNLIGQKVEVWKKNRNAWSLALTTSKLKAMFEILNKKSENIIKYLSNNSKTYRNDAVEARELSLNFLVDAILASIIGIETNSFEMKTNPYKNISSSLFNATFFEGIMTMSFMFLPGLAKLFRIRLVPKRVEKDLLVLARDILKKRQVTGFQKSNPFDAILNRGESTKDGVTEMEVAGILFSFLLDGAETSSGVMAYVLYSLASDIEIQKKLNVEIDNTFEVDDIVTYEKIQNLSYLDMVISETLRMYPPALTIQRLCTKPYQLKSIYEDDKTIEIPVGMPVIIPIYALHMDSKYFPDPEKFNPNRFSEENKKNIPKCAYIPFSEGPRVCIGFRLALNQIKVGLVNILRKFEVRLGPQMKNTKLEIDPNTFVMKPIGDIWVTFHEK